ncbi:hypothetical protein [Lactococcus garvieae]|uniref:hypothetical protein n=1 Tax=Lactococcus garvieae TaxID=1363 RepID=UPI00254D1877|nr:hypothetical protein [Lactococcus garvieae]
MERIEVKQVMEIKVFDINDTIREESLSEIAKENIEKVFLKIFSPSNTAHLKIDCYVDNGSILERYEKEKEKFDLDAFAIELHEAEKKTDGSRNKQITEGYLFIKRVNSRLMLLKLENIEVIDKEKNYEMKNSFSTEANYYKGCIFEGDLKNITIIDKNKSIAKYWRDDFLNLSLIKDDFKNSQELVSLVKSGKLLSENINSQDNFEIIQNKIENYIFENDFFDKIRVADLLRSSNLISQVDLNDIYSEDSKVLDTEFEISKKALKEGYKKTICLSEYTKIYTENYAKLYNREEIKYEDGRIILTVNEEFISGLPEELINGN